MLRTKHHDTDITRLRVIIIGLRQTIFLLR